jgi:antitoxin (DNA-binding transcriptional repressor) of toxin-antitoxin stability system
VKTVSKGKLQARMLEYFREVEATGEPLIVTDHGREVLEVRPATPRNHTATLMAELRALAKSAISFFNFAGMRTRNHGCAPAMPS